MKKPKYYVDQVSYSSSDMSTISVPGTWYMVGSRSCGSSGYSASISASTSSKRALVTARSIGECSNFKKNQMNAQDHGDA